MAGASPITLGSLPQVATGYAIGDIELTPTEITVFASGKALDTLTTILTAPFEEHMLKATTTTKVRLLLPEGSICLDQCGAGPCPRRATSTEQTFTLPVEVTGALEGFVLLPLPRVASRSSSRYLALARDIKPEELKIAASLSRSRDGWQCFWGNSSSAPPSPLAEA